MSESFDPYHKWLGIPPEEQPPHHYRLLGIKLFETDGDVIATAADARMMHLKSFQAGKHSALSQRLLNEIASAKVCLLSPDKRSAYDRTLRGRLNPAVAVPVASVPVAGQPDPNPRVAASTANLPQVSVSGRIARRRRTWWPWGIAIAGAGGVLLIALTVFLQRGEQRAAVVRSKAPASPSRAAASQPTHNGAGSAVAVEPSEEKPVQNPPKEADADSELPPELPRSNRLLSDLLSSPAEETPEQKKDLPAEPSADPAPPPEDVPEPDEKETPPSEAQEPPSRDDGKLPVPSEGEQKAMKGRIRELFREELHAAKQPREKSALAAKMFAQGAKTKNDAVLRFVFFDWAGSLAAEAGALDKTLVAADVLGQQYRVNVLSMKADKLTELTGAIRGEPRFADVQVPLIDAATRLAEAAVAKDDFDTAIRLAKLAQRAARAAKTAPLIRQTTARLRELERLAARRRAVRQNLDLLAKDSANGDANLAVGQWYCFAKGDWAKGLPYLAKGSDASVAELAQRDLRNPRDPKEQAALANAWEDLAAKEDQYTQRSLRKRAGHWYEAAVAKATGLEKIRLQKRLKQIAESLKDSASPTSSRARTTGALRVGEWVDLLDLVNLKKDCSVGKLERHQGALVLIPPPSTQARFSLPVLTGGSYELSLEFLGRGPRMGSPRIYLPVGNTACSLVFKDGYGESGIGRIDGKALHHNPTARKIPFHAGQRYSILVRVRATGEEAAITVILNKSPLFQWSGKQQSLTLGSVAMRDPHRPELGAWNYPMAYSNVRFRLLSGKATLVGFPDKK